MTQIDTVKALNNNVYLNVKVRRMHEALWRLSLSMWFLELGARIAHLFAPCEIEMSVEEKE